MSHLHKASIDVRVKAGCVPTYTFSERAPKDRLYFLQLQKTINTTVPWFLCLKIAKFKRGPAVMTLKASYHGTLFEI